MDTRIRCTFDGRVTSKSGKFWVAVTVKSCTRVLTSTMNARGVHTFNDLFTKLSRELVRTVTLESIWSVLTSTTVQTGDSFAACLTRVTVYAFVSRVTRADEGGGVVRARSMFTGVVTAFYLILTTIAFVA